jgi:hypothetical protein
VDWLLDARISDKHTVSIFGAEVICWDFEELCRVAGGEVRRKGPVRME